MLNIQSHEIWFITGTQFLYGDDALRQVAEHSNNICNIWNASDYFPVKIINKGLVTNSEIFTNIVKQANFDDKCLGLVVWCHTFSPSKMWIRGFSILQKPYCHLHTQYLRNIPNDKIDMDYMNLYQSAHADREHGYIGARMGFARKIIAGFWQDEEIQKRLSKWIRVAFAVKVSRNLRVMRFGDNMRDVAVTEGDKVDANIKLGWEVNTWAVGDLVQQIDSVCDYQLKAQIEEWEKSYENIDINNETIRYQARIECAIEKMLDEFNCSAFTNTFEDLWGMNQLPGIASQDLMRKGYGYGGEGDWKVAALTHVIKQMGNGEPGGTSFMEDYTYDLEIGNEVVLGSHMLEICPTVAAGSIKAEIHPLGIGNRKDPARLVFEGKKGEAIVSSLIDMGNRLRLIVQEINVIKPILEMPNLPVARVMWEPYPDLYSGVEAWILAGGSHHTVLSHQVNVEQLRDFSNCMGIEFVCIDKNLNFNQFKDMLELKDIAWGNL